MSRFSQIDLSKLPPPDVVEELDAETILDDLKADLVARLPEISQTIDLESEPLVKLLQVVAWRELTLRARINDATKSVMLALATGRDLDHLAALFGVSRLVVQAANPDAVPPVPELLEDDDTFRARVQLSLEGHTTAGTVGSYTYWAFSADGAVKDVTVSSPAPGEVLVTVLSKAGDGVPDTTVLNAVESRLNARDIRPLTDLVNVLPATILPYQVEATLTLFPGPGDGVVLNAAQAAVQNYVDTHHRLGHDITRAGLFAALFQEGVQNVTLTSPATDLIFDQTAAGYCTSIAVTVGGRDV